MLQFFYRRKSVSKQTLVSSVQSSLIEPKPKLGRNCVAPSEKMLKAKAFDGANVFMSRKLVPPEIFDALRDALNNNGAQVFLCSDPSRSGPDDFHIISSPDHEKFEDLTAKGCNLLGPQCVFSCAKEHRALPKRQGFTCCLAMEGVKVLATGFEGDEKGRIEKLVTSMGGVFHSRASSDVSFVIAKNVLAGKYKFAVQVLKKPVITADWLYQCWNEHRIVPHESFRVLPFSGLTICVTRIPADERKEMEKIITQNGGKYSAELTKKCTHLISDAPEGDKYKVARRWGNVHIINRKWFDQSVARRARLDEESYPVQGGGSVSSKKRSVKMQLSQGKDMGNLQSAPSSSVATHTNSSIISSSGFVLDSDVEATLSQSMCSTLPVAPVNSKQHGGEEQSVANDSEHEDSDLYLSQCRILLVGFETSEMRRLVNMVRRGGGSRYVLFNDKLTHIVVGTPSEIEKKEVRNLAAFGVIHVVRTTWLEDCDRKKEEIRVDQRHVAHDLLLPRGALMGLAGLNQGRVSAAHLSMPSSNPLSGRISGEIGMPSPLEGNKEEKPEEINISGFSFMATAAKSVQHSNVAAVNDNSENKNEAPKRVQFDLSTQNGKVSNVFAGKVFEFSSSFPEGRKGEIVQWIKQGGGDIADAFLKQSVNFTVECHGVIPKLVYDSQTLCVSSHWIRSCLEDGCLLNVKDHILYSPLPCWIPFPGFENFRFCVSQYEEKDRLLLRNLCFVLGGKLVGRLTKKVTHLICKFASGPKYEAACKWGIRSITSDWIYECVKQNKLVPFDQFSPKEITAQDQEAGLCAMSQFSTQAAQMMSGDMPSQSTSRSEKIKTSLNGIIGSSKESFGGAKHTSTLHKKARLLEDSGKLNMLSSGVHPNDSISNANNSIRNDVVAKGTDKVSHVVPDVAAAIEDLLEQTSKIHDQKSPGRTACDKSVFPSNCSTLGQDHSDTHSIVGLSKHWLNREKDDNYNSSGDGKKGMYDGFSETQTDSQIVGYEEDLSGRQMLIDRVRTRSSMT
uniref:BRCT domain-containing protein n=1 Tax=Cannabis sativa TaxID=3483 RepID=A0A803R0B0_CANSA